MRITKQGAQCATRPRSGHGRPPAAQRPLRGAADRLDRGRVLEHLGTDQQVTITASPSKGLEATLDLAERLTGHGYTAVPHLAARMVRTGPSCRDLRPADRQGHHQGLRPGRGRRPAGRLPGLPVAARGPHRTRPAVRPRGDHRLPRVAPDHQRRPHHPVDVGQAPLRHPRGQQPDLRPGHARDLGAADAGTRHHDAAAAGHPRSGRPDQAARHGHQIGVGESTRFLVKHKGTFARLAAPGGFTGERFLAKVAPAPLRPRCWSRGCTSSRSTRSPRPRSGAADCWTGSPPRYERLACHGGLQLQV